MIVNTFKEIGQRIQILLCGYATLSCGSKKEH